MSQTSDLLEKAHSMVAEAKLIALFKSGRRKDAFDGAIGSRPTLAAAFLTEAAEELRHSLRPSQLMMRASLLDQAAATLGGLTPRDPEQDAAVAWLESQAAETRGQAKALRLTYVIVLALITLTSIGLAYVRSS